MTPIVFGITGKLGTGKSSLAIALQDYDDSIVIIEVDDLRRYALWQSTQLHHIQLRLDLAQAFNLPVNTVFNWINREHFTRIIFENKDNLKTYSRITTPVLQYDLTQKIHNNSSIYAICWAYLLEENYDTLLNSSVIVTTCSLDTNNNRAINNTTDNRKIFEPTLNERISLLNSKKISSFIYENNQERFKDSALLEMLDFVKANRYFHTVLTNAYRTDMSFCKFRIPESKGRVIWEITNECNYGCKYCIFASTGRKPEGELTTKEIFNALQQLKQENFQHIKFTGGEPFLREDMVDILQETKRLNLECDISTNASKITPTIAQQLSNLNLPYIHVSIDGASQAEHEAVRGKKSFYPTLDGIKLLRNENITLRAGCVIHEYNENNLLAVATLCAQLGINYLVFSMMEPVGRLKGKNNLLAKKSLSILISDIEHIKKSYPYMTITHNLESFNTINFKPQTDIHCPAGKQFLFINSLGVVSPCTWVSEHRPDLIGGKIQHTSLASILSSEPIKNMHALALNLPNSCPMTHLPTSEKVSMALNAAKLTNHAAKFGQYAPIYRFSTENLIYFNDLHIENKKVLTIGGSYDHCIDLFLRGAKEVHNIDVNICAKYYANLKHEALTYFNFNQFQEFFIHSFDYHLFLTIKNKLETDTQVFFNDLYKQYNYEGHALMNSPFFHNSKNQKQYNVYLTHETNYLTAQQVIQKHTFVWYSDNIIELTMHNNYDLILLSNIADYSHKMFSYDHTQEFKNNVVLPLLQYLNPNGVLMFAYIFDYFNILHSDARNIFNSVEKRKELYANITNTVYEEKKFESSISNTTHDGICFLIKNENEE